MATDHWKLIIYYIHWLFNYFYQPYNLFYWSKSEFLTDRLNTGLLKPIEINTAKIGSDMVLLSDVPQKFYSVNEEIIKILPISFVIKEEQKLILEMVDYRKIFYCQGI